MIIHKIKHKQIGTSTSLAKIIHSKYTYTVFRISIMLVLVIKKPTVYKTEYLLII